jgi:outer membrane immunogenic protein
MKMLFPIPTALIVIGAVGAAHAADLPNVKGPPAFAPPPPPAFTWTGFYVGLNAGYDWAADPISLTPGGLWNTAFDSGNSSFIAANGSSTLRPSGFIGGGQVGLNYQVQNFVLGLEGDFDYTDLPTGRTTGILTAPVAGETFIFTSKVNALWL